MCSRAAPAPQDQGTPFGFDMLHHGAEIGLQYPVLVHGPYHGSKVLKIGVCALLAKFPIPNKPGKVLPESIANCNIELVHGYGVNSAQKGMAKHVQPTLFCMLPFLACLFLDVFRQDYIRSRMALSIGFVLNFDLPLCSYGLRQPERFSVMSTLLLCPWLFVEVQAKRLEVLHFPVNQHRWVDIKAKGILSTIYLALSK